MEHSILNMTFPHAKQLIRAEIISEGRKPTGIYLGKSKITALKRPQKIFFYVGYPAIPPSTTPYKIRKEPYFSQNTRRGNIQRHRKQVHDSREVRDDCLREATHGPE